MKTTGCFYGYATKGMAVFGVWLQNGDSEYIKTIKLKNATNNLAELHAIEYALKCIKNNDSEVELESCNSYVPRLFEHTNGVYKTKAERNVDMVYRARAAAAGFKSVQVKMCKSELMLELQELVRNEINGKSK